jgi:hypothetical protein
MVLEFSVAVLILGVVAWLGTLSPVITPTGLMVDIESVTLEK